MTEDLNAAPLALGGLTAVAAAIAQYLRSTRDCLSEVCVDMQKLLDVVECDGRQPCRADLEGIRESLRECLRDKRRGIDRIGVATALRYLTDCPYWMEWWGADARGGLESVGHSLNPQGDTFYDYSARAWFSIPREHGVAAVMGPYVDFGGINSYTYTVTISAPITTSRGFAGVAGADILADKFERFLLPVARDSEPVVLMNADLRVIASNTSRYLPGELLSTTDLTSWTRVDLAADVFRVGSSWQLASPTS